MSLAIKTLSAVAAVIAVFFAGYERGNRNVDRAAETMAAMFAVLNIPSIQAVLSTNTRDSIDLARDAVAQRDFKTATTEIASKISEIEQANCKPSGVVFAAEAGALVTNCETGMNAAVASINSNRTITVTIGSSPRSGAPGTTFSDSRDRFENCYLIYIALEEGSNSLQARMSFDCKGT